MELNMHLGMPITQLLGAEVGGSPISGQPEQNGLTQTQEKTQSKRLRLGTVNMSVVPAIWLTEAKLLGPRSWSQSGQHRSPVSKKGAKPEDIVESEHLSITHTPWV